MGYDGHFQAQPPSRERDVSVLKGSRTLLDSAVMIAEAGIPLSIVSTGGTGTYLISGSCEGITDIQAGSYLLMDTRYKDLGAPFQRSLTVLSTVISMRESKHAVIDCGLKEMSGERGLPALKDLPSAKLTALHAEHALIEIDTPLLIADWKRTYGRKEDRSLGPVQRCNRQPAFPNVWSS